MLSEVGPSKGRSYAVEAPHPRRKPFPARTGVSTTAIHLFPLYPVSPVPSVFKEVEVGVEARHPPRAFRERVEALTSQPIFPTPSRPSTIETQNAPRPHRRTSPTVPILRCPLPHPTPKYIDVHRSPPPLDRPHHPPAHPRRKRNRNPPLR